MEQYNEIWMQIDGYKNYYVSNFGRVKNVKNERILKQTIGTTGYFTLRLGRNSPNQRVHRLVAFAFCANPDNRKCVDHIDGNKLNNNFNNLRWCTNFQNNGNRKKQNHTTSKYKGTSYRKDTKKWRAYIMRNDVQIPLGCFDTEEEAGRAYDSAARELFGEFAKLNFP